MTKMTEKILEISVVIPAYNCMRTLPQVIAKLLEQSHLASGMEIIVIDDGSTDGTREWLSNMASSRQDVEFRCLFQGNLGPAFARNRGIEIARGKIILFLDADVIPSGELLSEHLNFHRQHPEDNLALRGKTIDARLPDNNNHTWTRPSVAAFKTKSPDKTNLPWVEFLSGNISLKRKFLIDQSLHFNEKLYVGEDVEFAFRAQKCGLILHFSDKAVGHHQHPITLQSFLNKGHLAGKSYATWYASFPDLKKELEKLGIEHYCGFIGSNRSLGWKLRQYIKRAIANSATYPIFYGLAKLKITRNHQKLYWIVRQVYEINFRRAFKKQIKLIRSSMASHGKFRQRILTADSSD